MQGRRCDGGDGRHGVCVYIVGRSKTTDSASLSITADVPQLLEFGDVHVEKDPASAGIAAYLASKGNPDEVVLY